MAGEGRARLFRDRMPVRSEDPYGFDLGRPRNDLLETLMQLELMLLQFILRRVADDFVHQSNRSVDCFEDLQRVLADDVAGALDLLLGDLVCGAISAPRCVTEEDGRYRHGGCKNPPELAKRVALRS